MVVHEKKRGEVTVRLDGELDHAMAQRIRGEIDELIRDARVTSLVFDLSGLNFMDSSGIGIILGRYRIMNRRGGKVSVTGAGRQVSRMFEMAGLDRLIERRRG